MKKPFIFKVLKYSLLTSGFLFTNISSAVGAPMPSIIPWTAVGAVGTPDKPAMVKYIHATPEVEIVDDATGAVRLFYQVRETDSLIDGSPNQGWRMTALYHDGTGPARVTIRLRQMDLATGKFTTVAKIDSQYYPLDINYQTQHEDFGQPGGLPVDPTAPCTSDFSFDFSNYAYYVVVKLKKVDLADEAGIQGIKIEPVTTCNIIL